MALLKNFKALTESPALKKVITWEKAERIRRNKEIWDDKDSIVHRLPMYYQQWYWKNLVLADRTPVHYKPPANAISWDEKRRVEVVHEENPIIGYKCKEQDLGLWAGERIVKSYRMSHPYVKKKVLPRRWTPRLYFPDFKYKILYSEVLDKYMRLTVTERALRFIDQHFGLDTYLLETKDIDIDSKFGLALKRGILIKLAKEDYYPDNALRRTYIKRKYAKYVFPLEQAEWMCMELNEAVRWFQDNEDNTQPEPLKLKFERELIQEEGERLASGDLEAIEEEEYNLYRPQESVIGHVLDPLFESITKRLRR